MSPMSWARLAGAAYLVIVFTGLFSEFAIRTPLIMGDPAETAANIAASETLFRFGGVLGFITLIADIIVAYALYEIFKLASPSLTRITVIFRLVFVAVMAPMAMFHFAPLFLLGGASYLQVIAPEQLEAMATMTLRMHSAGYQIALMFFGVHCLLAGWLFYQTRLIPRLIGLFMLAAGVAYIFNALVYFLAPDISRLVFPYIYLPPMVGEISLTLWLLVFGINMKKWTAFKESADACKPPA